jgi:hypothetical protein
LADKAQTGKPHAGGNMLWKGGGRGRGRRQATRWGQHAVERRWEGARAKKQPATKPAVRQGTRVPAGCTTIRVSPPPLNLCSVARDGPSNSKNSKNNKNSNCNCHCDSPVQVDLFLRMRAPHMVLDAVRLERKKLGREPGRTDGGACAPARHSCAGTSSRRVCTTGALHGKGVVLAGQVPQIPNLRTGRSGCESELNLEHY